MLHQRNVHSTISRSLYLQFALLITASCDFHRSSIRVIHHKEFIRVLNERPLRATSPLGFSDTIHTHAHRSLNPPESREAAATRMHAFGYWRNSEAEFSLMLDNRSSPRLIYRRFSSRCLVECLMPPASDRASFSNPLATNASDSWSCL